MKEIVVVGGGFGGVYAVKDLLRYFKHSDEVRVTLINPTNYFLFIPMLHEVATGGLCGHDLVEPFREIFPAKNFRFVKDFVVSVDLKKKCVRTANTELKYDTLVLATGSTANFHGVKGAEENALPLRNLADARHIKTKIVQSVEEAFNANDKRGKQIFCSVAVIGAGATGIELSIEIKELLVQLIKNNPSAGCSPLVYLIHSHEKILPQFPELQEEVYGALREHDITLVLNSKAIHLTENSITLDNGKRIYASVIIWSAGIKPHYPTLNSQDISTPDTNIAFEDGMLKVNEFLQMPKFKDVYVIGDCAKFIPAGEEKPLPALAQIASKQGKHFARNIYLLHSKKQMKPFDYNLRGILLSLGRGKGVAVIKGVKFGGFFAWWLMRTVYLFKIVGTVNKLKIAYDWTLNLFVKRDTTQS